ncbi:hypothetical protein FJ658_03870 [Schumannella sp. 10F1B-5-1]|nr:hypothetical protein FJ658_03870 [Schumannella sp. 10F1B-5-1]
MVGLDDLGRGARLGRLAGRCRRRDEASIDPVHFGVARRLDDLAYVAGVWWSALRGRSLAALKPDLRGDAGR